METLKLLNTALTALRVNMMRGVFTVLGIIVGVSVMLIMDGLERRNQKRLFSDLNDAGKTIARPS